MLPHLCHNRLLKGTDERDAAHLVLAEGEPLGADAGICHKDLLAELDLDRLIRRHPAHRRKHHVPTAFVLRDGDVAEWVSANSLPRLPHPDAPYGLGEFVIGATAHPIVQLDLGKVLGLRGVGHQGNRRERRSSQGGHECSLRCKLKPSPFFGSCPTDSWALFEFLRSFDYCFLT